MSRLTRAETQQRNRASVLASATAEFTERGFRDAKIDAIAERAELTRGGVYSNFPGKRALYFAVLADQADQAPATIRPGHTAATALGAFARAWVARLPLVTDEADPARIGVDLLPEILADEHTRVPYAQLLKLDAILLGLALESMRPAQARLVRVAEAVLTTLHGASQLAAAAPGFVEPFNVVSTCELLAAKDFNDAWHTPGIVPPARAANQPWTPPSVVDALTGEPARLANDGVLAILGLHRLSAVEDAVRTGAPVTLAIVTGDPAELGPLARLTLAELRSCLRQSFPPTALSRLQVVHDETGALAAAAGVPAVSDGTEVAVAIRSGRIVTRADGFGAGHAAATARYEVGNGG